MTEEWRPVVGFEGLYEVSDQGRVRSLDRRLGRDAMGRIRFWPGKILKPFIAGRYPYVELGGGTTRAVRTVHSLVAAAFLGPRPVGMEVRHLNGDYFDPRLVNLTYGTHQENMADMRRHGIGLAFHTHCKNGHEFTPENTRYLKRGHRLCRACRKLADAQRYLRKKERRHDGNA